MRDRGVGCNHEVKLPHHGRCVETIAPVFPGFALVVQDGHGEPSSQFRELFGAVALLQAEQADPRHRGQGCKLSQWERAPAVLFIAAAALPGDTDSEVAPG